MSAQEGDEDDDMSDNPQERSYKTSITTDDTSDEDFDAGHYSTPQGRKVQNCVLLPCQIIFTRFLGTVPFFHVLLLMPRGISPSKMFCLNKKA